jgi:hypothetical protein
MRTPVREEDPDLSPALDRRRRGFWTCLEIPSVPGGLLQLRYAPPVLDLLAAMPSRREWP